VREKREARRGGVQKARDGERRGRREGAEWHMGLKGIR
jgi:hypothetical protein